MGDVHMDAADLGPAFVDQCHLIVRLDEEERRDQRVDDEAWNASRIAAFARPERNLSGQHFVVRLLHLGLCPILKDRIGKIGDAIGRLLALAAGAAIVDIGVARIVDDRPRTARRRQELVAHLHPGRSELGVEDGCFRRGLRYARTRREKHAGAKNTC